MLRFDVKKSGIPGLKTVNPVYPVTGEYLLIAKSRHALMEGLSAESGKVFRAIRAFNRAIHEREAEERGDYDLEPASAEQAAAEQQQLFDGYVYLQMWEHSQGPVNAAAHAQTGSFRRARGLPGWAERPQVGSAHRDFNQKRRRQAVANVWGRAPETGGERRPNPSIRENRFKPNGSAKRTK